VWSVRHAQPCIHVRIFPAPEGHESSVNLGAFSVSLAVKDIGASNAFYETLGFVVEDPDGNTILVDQHR